MAIDWRRYVIVPIGAAALIGGFTVVSAIKPDRTAAPPTAPMPVPENLLREDRGATLARVDAEIAQLEARVATRYGDMIDREDLASNHLSRFRMTGSWDELAAAQRHADAGVAMMPKGHGPLLVRASIALATHRLAAAEADLAFVDKFVVPDRMTKSDARAMRGDIALARGDLRAAAGHFEEAGKIERWSGLYWRKGALAMLQGDFEGARRHYLAADTLNRSPLPAFRADSLIRQGEIDLAEGKWPEATAKLAEAGKLFPGWWKVEMRVAQMKALNGDVPGGIAGFERIAETDKLPEAMDILAGLHRAQGNAAASRQWSARAGAIWTQRLAQFPEAAWGHAVEHELAFGDAKKALALAGRNMRNRPYGPSAVLLAKAWLANGRADYALALTQRAARQGFVSTDLWLTQADALARLGKGEAAEAARDKAAAINPKALDRNPAFAWLDH